jgi:hypothetical protein
VRKVRVLLFLFLCCVNLGSLAGLGPRGKRWGVDLSVSKRNKTTKQTNKQTPFSKLLY